MLHFVFRSLTMFAAVAALVVACPAIAQQKDPEALAATVAARLAKLNEQAVQLADEGNFAGAVVATREVVAILQQVFPAESHPDGHKDLATALTAMGFALFEAGEVHEAEKHTRRSLAMWRRLYSPSRRPKGHPQIARTQRGLSVMLKTQGRYSEALRYATDSLQMLEGLYPEDEHPGGDAELAESLNAMGVILLERGELFHALPNFERALAMYRRVYPEDEFPQGHADIASALRNLGTLYQNAGAYDQSRQYCEQALQACQMLYPESEFPNGHPELAVSYHRLGYALQFQGELQQARRYYEQALEMQNKLFPAPRYPRGHPDLATTLNSMGGALEITKDYDGAARYFERALDMLRRLYPEGHPYIPKSLQNLALLEFTQGKHGQARTRLEQALAMNERLYSTDAFPDGHPELGNCLQLLGGVFQEMGEYERAEEYSLRALKMWERFFTPEGYHQGHPYVAVLLKKIGILMLRQEKNERAADYLGRCTKMENDLAAHFMAAVSEAEALNYAAAKLGVPSRLISLWPRTNRPDEELYEFLWVRRAMIYRLMRSRQRALHGATAEVAQQYARYLETRRALARLTFGGAAFVSGGDRDRLEELTDLGERKESLERALAERLPRFREEFLEEGGRYGKLAERLPLDTVLVDFVCFCNLKPEKAGLINPGGKWDYLAFVVRPGRPALRVPLGSFIPVDPTVKAWREAIAIGNPVMTQAEELRRLIWEPVERQLPRETKRVLICPEISLTAVPWAALPGKRPGTFLVDDFAIATVPHGQFVLETLSSPLPRDPGGTFLAVGDVDYDASPPSSTDATRVALRAPAVGENKIEWSPLAETKAELDAIGILAAPRHVMRIDGADASPSRVLAVLPQARWALFATHGFFADASFRSTLELPPQAFSIHEIHFEDERTSVGGRNPLLLSGLVLAGANRSRTTAASRPATEDCGILTAEAIAGSDLRRLDLAVLSACETGLGDLASGEGVFGLQRAFHLAGTRSVVASLWKVDDDATRALMVEFHRNLWDRRLGKLEALRQAQLAILRQYDPQRGVLRGPGAVKPVDPTKLAKAANARSENAPALSPFYWAGFVLSGDWR